MRNRVWLIAGVAAAVLTIAATATATTTTVTRAGAATPAAAPFSESWASVPRTTRARKAKSVLVFGMEQDITGFNTALTCCSAYWAAVTGNTPELRGAYNIDNKLRHVLDLVTSAKASAKTLTFVIRPDANWYWGGKKIPVTYKDFAYT